MACYDLRREFFPEGYGFLVGCGVAPKCKLGVKVGVGEACGEGNRDTFGADVVEQRSCWMAVVVQGSEFVSPSHLIIQIGKVRRQEGTVALDGGLTEVIGKRHVIGAQRMLGGACLIDKLAMPRPGTRDKVGGGINGGC